MNYYQVQQFLSIVKHMNLSVAAKELYLTQPALSRALSRLEGELGVQLFIREGHKLILSAEGKKLLPYFRKFTDSYDELFAKLEELKYEKKRRLNLGFQGSMYMYMSFFMTPFLKEFNGIPIVKMCTDIKQLQRMLNEMSIDFAISQQLIPGDKIQGITLMKEEIVLVVSSNHPLAKQDSVKLHDIADLKLTGYDISHSFRELCDGICMQNGFKPTYAKELHYGDYTEEIQNCAGADDYAAFCPRKNAEYAYGKFGRGYKILDIVQPAIYRQTVLSWNKEAEVQYEFRDFAEYVQNGYEEQHEFYLSYTKDC